MGQPRTEGFFRSLLGASPYNQPDLYETLPPLIFEKGVIGDEAKDVDRCVDDAPCNASGTTILGA
jgi:hypothetical protein